MAPIRAQAGERARAQLADHVTIPELTRREIDERFMKNAIAIARDGIRQNEVPIGAVITRNDKIIAAANNRTVRDQDATSHAEMIAIRDACGALDSWRLEGCTLYVTLEPCAMCAGAMVLSRISRVIFGAWDSKAGMAGSVGDLLRHAGLNHTPEVQGGVMEEECRSMLTGFFESMRAYSRTI